MINKLLIALGLFGILVGGGFWAKDGFQIFSKDREMVVTEKRDELFGTISRETTFVPAFKFGLLPLNATVQDVPLCYAFVGGVSIVLLGVGFWNGRKQQSNS